MDEPDPDVVSGRPYRAFFDGADIGAGAVCAEQLVKQFLPFSFESYENRQKLSASNYVKLD
jgi:hypothetical protein